MTKHFYVLDPEVPGFLTGNSFIDRSTTPPKIKDLEVAIQGWMGGLLLTVHPGFFIEDNFRKSLEAAKLTGLSFGEIILHLEEGAPEEILKNKFSQLIPIGVFRESDFSVDTKGRLVVSERALTELQKFELGDFSARELTD